MKIYELKERTPQLSDQLLDVWEKSVRATHLFLSEPETERIKGYVPQAIKDVEHLAVAKSETGVPVAFMGVDAGRLEMLFISPEERGKGLGRQLLEYGIGNYDIKEVTVNEQNPQAVGFYEHMGFRTYKRTACDEDDGLYPLLYMKLDRG